MVVWVPAILARVRKKAGSGYRNLSPACRRVEFTDQGGAQREMNCIWKTGKGTLVIRTEEGYVE